MGDKPEEKQFGLKQSEVRMLNGFQQLYGQTLSLFLSFIAMERLAYPVTERTQFRVEGDKIFIHEMQPEQAHEVTVAGEATSKAIKGKKNG